MPFSGVVRRDLVQHAAFIDGEWVSSETTLDVVNPATEQVIGHVPDMGKKETEEAVEAAWDAQKGWAAMPIYTRSRILHAWAEAIMTHRDDLARIMTIEQGKPVKEAAGEITYAYSFVRWYAEEIKRCDGHVISAPKEGVRILTKQEPLGVVGMITPWNFPAAMITRKAAPALAAGCAVVIKPSELTPFTALALAVLAQEAGIPAGVLNVITGDAKPIGQVLTTHEKVRGFSFTGSTKVGRQLMAQCSSTVKKVALELGGNAPFIVCEDADMDAAIDGLMAAKFRNAGQTCICPNRVLVHHTRMEEVIARLTKAMEALTIGNGLDDGVALGPLINANAVEKVQTLVEDALEKGATEMPLSITMPREGIGYYTQPRLLAGITPAMDCFATEIFGPVVTLTAFTTDEQAIQLANDTIYGLASYIYSENHRRLWRYIDGLESGMVGANETAISMAPAPFGGVKQSGIGREGGHWGLEEFTETKYVALG